MRPAARFVSYQRKRICHGVATLSVYATLITPPAAQVVSDTGKFDRGLKTILHDELHWLDVPERTEYKLGVGVSVPVSERTGTSVPRRSPHSIIISLIK